MGLHTGIIRGTVAAPRRTTPESLELAICTAFPAEFPERLMRNAESLGATPDLLHQSLYLSKTPRQSVGNGASGTLP